MMVPATCVSTDKGATHDTEDKDCLAHGHTTPRPGDLIQTTFTGRAAPPRIGPPVADPVASGIVARLNRPGGNITGFANVEASMGGKWLELLSEIAPGLKRG